MRKLLIAVLVLVAIAVAVDVFARRVAEDRVAGRLRSTFELSSEPEVSLKGTPFLLAILRGDISTIEMSADRVRSEDVTLEDVDVEMHDVRFSLSEVIDGSDRVSAGGGTGSASITEGALNRALADAGAPFTLSFDAGAVRASTEAGEVEGEVSLQNDALTIGAQGLPPVVLDLPSLGGRVAYEEIAVESGRASLSFSVERVRLNR